MAVHLTLELVWEWAYRYSERVGMMCEDRIPTQRIRDVATAEANEWISSELVFDEVDRELAF